jgi:hypothetical protein
VEEVSEDWCLTGVDDNPAFTAGITDPICDAHTISSNLIDGDEETTLSIGIKSNGGLVTRPPTLQISFGEDGVALATPERVLGKRITIQIDTTSNLLYSAKSINGPDGTLYGGVVIPSTGYTIFHGDDMGLPLAKEYTISCWVKGMPDYSTESKGFRSLFKGPTIFNSRTKLNERGSDHFILNTVEAEEGANAAQYVPINEFGTNLWVVSTVAASDLFNQDGSWSRLTLVAVGGKTRLYKDDSFVGQIGSINTDPIFRLGSTGVTGTDSFGTIADIKYWDVPLEPFELEELFGVNDRSTGICVCSLSSLRVAKARYSDKSACQKMDAKSNMVEVFTSSLRDFDIKEGFEYVWPYPKAFDATSFQLRNPQARSMCVFVCYMYLFYMYLFVLLLYFLPIC